MLKIFLVEDEVNVREGIKNHIHWEAEGFEFIGEAGDGELAYPLIQKLKPDILITDIKMPFMNGLELGKLVKQEFPNIQIIILSGHNEFDYAKEAVNMGVSAYISKPITGTKLLEKVKQVGNVILTEREEKNNLEMFKREYKENSEIKREHFFEQLVTLKLSMSEIITKGKELGMELTASVYRIFLIKVFENAEEQYEYQQEVIRTEQEVFAIIDEYSNAERFPIRNEGTAVILKAETLEQMEEREKALLDMLVLCITKNKNIKYFVGVGTEVNRISELQKSFEDAKKAFAYSYIIPPNQVLRNTHLDEYKIEKDVGVDMSNIDLRGIDKKIVENFLKVGAKEEIHDFIEEYFASIGMAGVNSLMFRQYIAMDMYILCFGLLEELNVDIRPLKDEFGDLGQIHTHFTSIRETKKYLEQIFLKTIQLRNNVVKRKYLILISDAKKYIQENLSSHEISLNTTARSVGVSPSYFSTIFSQETGETFIEYLTKVRMKKAKELLCCTTMKSMEVAFEVGYKDAHYFSYIFKKTQGCTPKEFRQKIGGNN